MQLSWDWIIVRNENYEDFLNFVGSTKKWVSTFRDFDDCWTFQWRYVFNSMYRKEKFRLNIQYIFYFNIHTSHSESLKKGLIKGSFWLLKCVCVKVVMQGKLFQKCTHLLHCSVLSLGGNINTRRILQPEMGSIFHIKQINEIFWS